jgi:hypothetical protein
MEPEHVEKLPLERLPDLAQQLTQLQVSVGCMARDVTYIKHRLAQLVDKVDNGEEGWWFWGGK